MCVSSTSSRQCVRWIRRQSRHCLWIHFVHFVFAWSAYKPPFGPRLRQFSANIWIEPLCMLTVPGSYIHYLSNENLFLLPDFHVGERRQKWGVEWRSYCRSSLLQRQKVKSLYLSEHIPEYLWGMEVRLHRVVYGSAAWAAEQLWKFWRREKVCENDCTERVLATSLPVSG